MQSDPDPNPTTTMLVEHVRRALVHELGATTVDVWLGKDGVHQHSTTELAEIAVGALAPVLDDAGVEARVAGLHAAGSIAPPIRLDPSDW